MSILLSTSSFTLEARIDTTPEAVLAVLDEPLIFIRLSPLVVSAEPAPGEVGCYLVTERPRLLGVPFDVRCALRWQPVAGGVDITVRTSPATRLDYTLRVLPEGAVSRARASLRLCTPRPFAGYGHATAQATQREILDRLKRRAEGGTPRAR